MSLAGFWLLTGTMIAVSAAPGPADAAVAARAAAAGPRQAWLMIGGIVLADYILIALALFGLKATAVALGELSGLIELAGGILLVSFGAVMLRPAAAPASAVSAARPTSSLASLAAGMALTLADPKAIVFYLSLLPAFVDLERAGAGAAAAVMLAATLAIALVKGLWVALVLRAGERLRARMTRRGLRLLGAAVLLAVGLLSMLAGAAALLDLPAGLAV